MTPPGHCQGLSPLGPPGRHFSLMQGPTQADGAQDTGQAGPGRWGQQGDGSGCCWRGHVSCTWKFPALAATHPGKVGVGILAVILAPRPPRVHLRQHTWDLEASATTGQWALTRSAGLAEPQTHKQPSDQPTCVYWEPTESRVLCWALGEGAAVNPTTAGLASPSLGADRAPLPHSASHQPCRSRRGNPPPPLSTPCV